MHSARAEKILLPTTNEFTPSAASASATPAVPSGTTALADAPRWVAKRNLVETLAASGRFETIGRALEDTHLTDLLTEKGPFTVFAPTDEAFAKLPSAELRSLLAEKPRLRSLLTYHIVAGKVRAPRERVPNTATTVDGRTLTMSVTGGCYRVGDAQIVQTNLRAANGVIHAIDTLLTPR